MLASAFGLAAMLALQGCGGGGDDKTTVTTTGTTTPTTTSTSSAKLGPGGLRYCEDVSTFYRVVVDGDGVKTATGQCVPSTSPGAYYTKPGEKDPENDKSDRPWGCWHPGMDKSAMTNEAAKAFDPPFEGACWFADYNSDTTPDKVEDCDTHLDHHPAVCSPGPSKFWGACWSSQSENWKCIPVGDGTIKGLAKGDCKSQVLQNDDGTPTTSFYDGVCRFKQHVLKKYKCDTVPGYSSTASSTCGGSNSDKACFTLKQTPWQCFGKEENPSAPCDWTLLPASDANEDGKFYRGYCVFKGNEDYKDAFDAHNLTKAVDHRVIV
jgi:hypothetical protein